MLSVILCHVLPIDLKNRTNLAVESLFLSINMPLFIFISGYYTKVTDWGGYFGRGVLRLLETLAVFTLFHFFISYLQGKPFRISAIIYPRWTLWYMVSLIWWRILLYYIPKKIRDNYGMLITIGVLVCLIAGFIPIDTGLSFQRTFSFLPFFLVGYVAGKEKIVDNLRINMRVAVTFLIMMGIVFFILNSKMNDYFFQKWSYFHYNSAIIGLCVRAGWLFCVTVMSICFLSVVPQKEYKWTHFGQITLFIYMWHSIILSWRFIMRDTYALPTNFPFCMLYAIVVIAIVYFMSKVKVCHWLLNPLTPFLYKKK